MIWINMWKLGIILNMVTTVSSLWKPSVMEIKKITYQTNKIHSHRLFFLPVKQYILISFWFVHSKHSYPGGKVVLGFVDVCFLFDDGGLFGKLLIISVLSLFKFWSSLSTRPQVSSLVVHFWMFVLKWQQFSTLNSFWLLLFLPRHKARWKSMFHPSF